MTMINKLTNINWAKTAKKTAVTVYVMTVIKAGVRPAFIMTDKKNDTETKKYTAAKEVLYQVLCIGMAVALMPLFERGGFKLAEKQLKNIKGLEKITKYNQISEFSKINKVSEFKKDYLDKSFDEKFHAKSKTDKKTKLANEAMHLVNGGVETGSFVASILGLTILAPLISHEILHPILKAVGLNTKESNNPALEKLQAPYTEADHHTLNKTV